MDQLRDRYGLLTASAAGGVLRAKFQRADDPDGTKSGYKQIPPGCNRLSLACVLLGVGTSAVVDVFVEELHQPVFRVSLQALRSYQVDCPWYKFELRLVALGAPASAMCTYSLYKGP